MQSSTPSNDGSSSSARHAILNPATAPAAARNGHALTEQPGTTRQPIVYASKSSGTLPVSDGVCLQDQHAQGISALNEQLRSLRDTNPLDFENVLRFFDAAKAMEQELKFLLRDDPHNAGLRKLANGLYAILPSLRVLPCGDGSASLTIDTIRTLCLGLSACVAPTLGTMFDKKRRQALKQDLQLLTDALMQAACKAGLTAGTAPIGDVLNILNWASRALKADCINVSQPIKDAFDKALAMFEESLAGKLRTCGLTNHQLGKCAVQIDAILKFRLINLDDSEEGLIGRRRLAACGGWLCCYDMAARLGAGEVDAVACTNVCNLVKDMMEHGLLSVANNGQLTQGLVGLASLIARIAAHQMLADDCRTLSNCANFLRVLGDHGTDIKEQALVSSWVAASGALLAVINRDAFMACRPSGQAITNLISFVKSCDWHLQRNPGASLSPASALTTTTAAPMPPTATSTLTTTVWSTTTTTTTTTTATAPPPPAPS